jgi:hypothetical protein
MTDAVELVRVDDGSAMSVGVRRARRRLLGQQPPVIHRSVHGEQLASTPTTASPMARW